jgi:hypothetical protein
MKKIKRKSWLLLLFVGAILLVSACANIVAPTGGPADRTPPVYVKSEPGQRSVSFIGKKLKITFNEFVMLNDAANQVVVSPPLKELPEFRASGKSVIVEFREALKDSTTYTLYFNDCIEDITENNPFSGFHFSFSTGAYTDSMKVAGIVVNAFTLEAEKGTYVMLYKKPYDSIPYKEVPDYIAKTATNGLFEIDNIAPGKYMVFSLRDANYNLLFDQPNEQIAFYDSLVIPQYIPTIDTAKKNFKPSDSLAIDTVKPVVLKQIVLKQFEEVDTIQRLLKAKSDMAGRVQMIFKWPVGNLKIRFLKNPKDDNWKLEEYGINRDTINCWIRDIKTDSLFIEVSDNGIVLDTIELGLKKLADSAQVKGSGGKGSIENNAPFKLLMSPNASNGRKFDLYRKLNIRFLHPIKESDFSKIIIKEMPDTIGKIVTPSISFIDSDVKRNLLIDYPWKVKMRYELFIPPGTFTDIYGLKNDTLLLIFTTTDIEDYGVLKVNLKIDSNKTGPYIFQLLGDNKTVIQERNLDKPGSIQFDYLSPGNYTARIIMDKNGNRKWDTGKYIKKIQPETIYNYPAVMTLKANWDTEIDWEL